MKELEKRISQVDLVLDAVIGDFKREHCVEDEEIRKVVEEKDGVQRSGIKCAKMELLVNIQRAIFNLLKSMQLIGLVQIDWDNNIVWLQTIADKENS